MNPVITSAHNIPPHTPYSQWERAEYQSVLGANGFGESRDEWRRAAQSGAGIVRTAACALLALAPVPADRSVLEGRLADRDQMARAWALLGTARMGREESRAELKSLTAQPLEVGDSSALIAAGALARLGDASGLPVVQAAMASDVSRMLAVRWLIDFARLQPTSVAPQYAAALADPSRVARELALAQLEELQERQLVPILEAAQAQLPSGDAQQQRIGGLLARLKTRQP